MMIAFSQENVCPNAKKVPETLKQKYALKVSKSKHDILGTATVPLHACALVRRLSVNRQKAKERSRATMAMGSDQLKARQRSINRTKNVSIAGKRKIRDDHGNKRVMYVPADNRTRTTQARPHVSPGICIRRKNPSSARTIGRNESILSAYSVNLYKIKQT